VPTREERLSALEQGQGVISEVLAIIAQTQAEHTRFLVLTVETINEHIARLDVIDQRFDAIDQRLEQHTTLLNEHTALLRQILDRLPPTKQ
jgi:DNA repair ATPase RecN